MDNKDEIPEHLLREAREPKRLRRRHPDEIPGTGYVPDVEGSVARSRWTKAAEDTVAARRPVHGNLVQNMDLTARLWSTYIDGLYAMGQNGLTGKDVCALNILQKMSRDVSARELNPDNWIDVCGYVLCIQKLTGGAE